MMFSPKRTLLCKAISDIPSNVPFVSSSTHPSEDPSIGPSNAPSVSNKPYTVPSMGPSTRPSEEPEPSFDPGNTPSTLYHISRWWGFWLGVVLSFS